MMSESNDGSNNPAPEQTAAVPAEGGGDATDHAVTVDQIHDGSRLDMAVAALVPGVSRSAAQRLIELGEVRVNGRKRPQGYRVVVGATLQVRIPTPPPRTGLIPQTGGELDILYEDDQVLAVAKKPGTVVHPGAGHQSGTLVNQLIASGRTFSIIGGEDRPGLVHRLDKDTSGVILLAKSDAAHSALAKQFKDRTIRKAYLAIVLGAHLPDRGEFRSSFGRRPGDRKQFTGRVSSEREAITEYQTVMRASLCALVVARPRTGRTHQIRVHLAEGGHPIVGDHVYGRAYPRPGSQPEAEVAAMKLISRQALHAWGIRFTHPADGRWIEIIAQPPRDFRIVLDAVFGETWRETLSNVPIDG